MDRKDQNVVADWLKTPQSGRTYMTTPPSSARNWVRNKAVDTARGLGVSKYGAQDLGDILAGDYTNGMGIGAADFLPGLGTYMGAEEGVDAYQRGDAIGATAGALGTAASLLPVVGPLMSKGVRAGAVDAGAAFLKDQFGGVPIPGKRTPVTSEDLRSGDELFYSPSLLAAANLPMPKGTYQQMRAGLLKGGGKEAELQWSGFDKQFGDRADALTQPEIETYFRNQPAPYRRDTREATGELGTGKTRMSDDELVENYVRDSLSDEAYYYRTDYLPQRLAEDHRQVSDLDADELLEAAESVGMEDDLEAFQTKYGDYWLRDDSDLTDFVREKDAVESFFGDVDYMAEESLRENARYGMDLDDLREQYGQDDVLDPGDTEYSEYFPGGGNTYRENVSLLDKDRLNEITGLPYGRDLNAPDHGFGVGGDPVPFWSRSANFPDRSGDSVGTTRYVGEVQSSWAQDGQGATNPKRTKTLAEEMAFADLLKNMEPLKAAKDRASDEASILAPYPDATDFVVSRAQSPADPGTRMRMGVETAGGVPLDSRSYPLDRFGQRFLQENLGRVPQRLLDEAGVERASDLELSNLRSFDNPSWSPQNVRGQRDWGARDLPPLSEAWVRQNQGLPEGSLPGLEEAPIYRQNSRWVDEHGGAADAYEEQRDVLDAEAQRFSAGPYVRKTEDWATQALRNELADAVTGGANSLTFNSGADELVQAVSGGNLRPQTFYTDTLPPIAQKLAKGYGGQVEQIPVRINDTNQFVPGIRLTPEFIAEVKRKGIPYFMVPGGMMLGAAGANEGRQEGF